MILISTAYLPPVQYMSKFLQGEVHIEKYENYQKQSFRNRCCIYGANGIQCLVIPVKKNHGEKTPVTHVEVDFTMNWKGVHLKSIESAYRLSPFYEYYMDDIHELYAQQIPLLYDWNKHILKAVLQMLDLRVDFKETAQWEVSTAYNDFRQSISPKSRLARPDSSFIPVPYQQVFIERYGFIPNLSIIDLLFNEGPQSLSILKNSLYPPLAGAGGGSGI